MGGNNFNFGLGVDGGFEEDEEGSELFPAQSDSPIDGFGDPNLFFAPDRESLLLQQAKALDATKAQRSSAIEDLYASQTRLSPEEVGVTALTTLLPILIGAGLHGKKGLGYGARSAAVGGGTYLKGLALEDEQEKKKALLQAQVLKEREGALTKQVSQNQEQIMKERQQEEMFNRAEAGRNARAITMAKGMRGPEAPLPDSLIKDLNSPMMKIQTAQGLLNEIAQSSGGIREESFTDENGNFDPNKAVNVFKNHLEAALLGAESERGRLKKSVQRVADIFTYNITGANATADLLRRYQENLTGGSEIAPGTVKALAENLVKVIQEGEQEYLGKLQNYEVLKSPGNKVEAGKAFLNSLRSGDTPIPSTSVSTEEVGGIVLDNIESPEDFLRVLSTIEDGSPITLKRNGKIKTVIRDSSSPLGYK